MKQLRVLVLVAASFSWVACNNAGSRYVDLNTGETIKLEKDESGVMVNAETKRPVDIYVDTKTNDTIYARTGKVINGYVVKSGDTWVYKMDDDGDYKVKAGDYKMKVEKDGDVKVKDGDSKTKVDGETGEVKKKDD